MYITTSITLQTCQTYYTMTHKHIASKIPIQGPERKKQESEKQKREKKEDKHGKVKGRRWREGGIQR